jgi:UDP-N-acetylglucosamine 2-epimerase
MPEELNRIVADHLSTWLFAPTPAAVANLAAEGIRGGVVEVGDLMLDLAARTSAEVRDPAAPAVVAERLALEEPALAGVLAPGNYLFATVHRAENRSVEAMRAWTALLGDVAAPDRPVVLALHPGTRAALLAAGVELPDNVHVIEPQGYRTSLTLQLHAAAVLTDSGGVQREAAWLGVPCLVLRSTTEWVETVGSEGSSAVLVGLDRAKAVRELEARAPRERSAVQASARAAGLHLEGSGAAERIVAALASARVPAPAARAAAAGAPTGAAR